MGSYEQELAVLQAESWAALERDLAKAAVAQNPVKNEQITFLILLIRARRAQGLSQAQLAAKLGMQQSAISHIESGRGNPSLHTLLVIAKTLGVRLVIE